MTGSETDVAPQRAKGPYVQKRIVDTLKPLSTEGRPVPAVRDRPTDAGPATSTVDGTGSALAYDRWFERAWGSYAFEVELRALLDAFGPLTGRRLLDVGCGTGRFTASFEDAGAQVTGVDRDPAMLTIASGRVTSPLVEADAHALPFPDATFDVAVAITLLEFADRPDHVVDELVRVTRPGGRLAVATLNPHSPWGLAHRRRLHQPPWTDACLRTRQQLGELVADRGTVQLHAALYAPGPLPGLHIGGPAIERIGRLAPAAGAFQIAVVDLTPVT